MKPDPLLGQVPESDWHSLARVDFGKVIGETGYATDKTRDKSGKFGFFKHSLGYITGLSASLHLTYHESGFVRMVVIDTDGPNGDGFNRQNYTFSFVRNEFLGTIPTIVLDVQPVKKQRRPLLRPHLDRAQRRQHRPLQRRLRRLAAADITEYYHFDSWRTNVTEACGCPPPSTPKKPTPSRPRTSSSSRPSTTSGATS